MCYIFNIEVFHNNVCIGQIEDFCSMDNTLDEWTANTLVERARKDKEWHYYCITCFEESTDGTQTLKNTIKVNNEENPLTEKKFLVTVQRQLGTLILLKQQTRGEKKPMPVPTTRPLHNSTLMRWN